MKSKMSKKLIAFILCMVLVICNSVSILADTPAPETATVEKQVKETKTANDKKASDDEAGDTENVSPQSEESAPEVKTTEKKEETTEATTQKKDEADEVTTKAKEETEKADETTTEAKETTKKEETTETQEEKTTKAKEETSETSGEKNTEKTTEAEEKTAPTELTYDDENVTVTVSAVAKGAIPADATLKVVPILKDDTETKDQYTEVEQKIQEKAAETETEIKGFLAYDITFVDADGNEIEPNSEVKVSMEYKEAALPAEITAEDAKTSEVSVMHLEEDDAGNVSKVVDMGEAGKVDTLETTDAKQVEKVEVKTESFSSFVITWGSYEYNRCTVTAKYVYINQGGQAVEFSEKTVDDVTLEANEVLDLTDPKYQREYFDGYKYVKTVVANSGSNVADGTEITSLKATYDNYTYYIGYHEKDNPDESNYTAWLDTDEWDNRLGTIYYVYEKCDLEIVNDIIENGTLKVENNGEEITGEATYEWFSSTEENGSYTPVEKKNYQDGGSNLSEDGSLLYPSYDEGARKWYKVEVAFATGEKAYSAPFQVPYYDELKNGDFESPVVSEGSNMQYGNKEYVEAGGVWQSTAEVYNNYYPKDVAIEIVRKGADNGGAGAYNWFNKPGDTWETVEDNNYQFAELNCQAAGALYQDVLTTKDEPLNYWLSHRARGIQQNSTPEFDTMYLVIMPTKTAQDNNLTTQTQLKKYLNALLPNNIDTRYTNIDNEIAYQNKDEGILVVRVTSNDQSWQNIEKLSGYRPVSSVTRFFFVAGLTENDYRNGDGARYTVGNFLDNVGFSQDLPDVANDEFSLEINKKFSGLSSADMESVKSQIQFKISATDKDGNELEPADVTTLFGKEIINGSEMQSWGDGSLHYTITNRQINTGEIYNVTITELNADVGGYSMSTEVQTRVTINGEETSNVATSKFELKGQTIAYVTFTNAYDRAEKKDINFTKVWDDNKNQYGTRPDSLDVTLKATVTINGTEKEFTANELGVDSLTHTVKGEDWNTSWKNVPVYYTDDNGDKCPIEYTVTERNIDSEYVYTKGTIQNGDGSDYEPTITDKTFSSSNETVSTKNSSTSRAASTSVKTLAASANTAKEANNTDNQGLGEPLHNKYVQYNADTNDYTLNLDVKGAQGEASGVDVLFVIDTSGSMGDNVWIDRERTTLLKEVKSLLADDNGIIDQILEDEGNVNSVGYVSFSSMRNTQSSSWYDANDNTWWLKQNIKSLSASGGTNWTAAMLEASDMLDSKANDNNEKVVIFLSDGKPTFSAEQDWRGQWNQTGTGSDTENRYYQEAANIVTKSSSLSKAQIYSVYLTSGTKSGMETFSDKLSNSTLIDGTNLSTSLESVLETIIPTYENVVITDTLSEYVDFVDKNVTVTVKYANGYSTTLNPNQYRIEWGDDNKTIKVHLLNGNSLENGATYTASFKIQPNDNALNFKGEYPDTGDPGTGSTSANKKGFYSNEENTAKVTYTVNDNPDEADYPKPVVQLNTHDLTFTKVWSRPSSVEIPNGDVTLNVRYSNGTTETITLNEENDYTFTKTKVPVSTKIESVQETSSFENFTPSYVITDDGTKATVTNTYSKVSASHIKVVKKWEGDEDNTDARPSNVTVGLYQNTEDGNATLYDETKQLTVANSWRAEWTNLPQDDGNGNFYSYSVREMNIPVGYTSVIGSPEDKGDYTQVTITNTYDPNCADEDYYIANVLEKETVTVSKTWDDNNNKYGKRPTSLDVTLTRDGKSYDATLQSDNWETTFTLPRKKQSSANDYSIQEHLASDSHYKQVGEATIKNSGDGWAISLTNEIDLSTIYTSVIVKKDWQDGELNSRPENITFKLQYRENPDAEWKDYDDGIYTLIAEDKDINDQPWTKKIDNLPINNEYQVVEVNVADGYHSNVKKSDDGTNTFIITNTLNWSLKKTNSPEDDEAAVPLSGATFDLADAKNVVIAQGTSGEDGFVEWTLTQAGTGGNVDLENLNGVYTLSETKAPTGYQRLTTVTWKLTFENGLLTSAASYGQNDNPLTSDGKDTYVTLTKDSENGVVVALENDLLYELPETGGSGTYWYTVSGALLMMGAALIVYREKRKREVLLRK